jgi:hypothetical protein
MLKTNNKSVRTAIHDHIVGSFDDFDNFKHDVKAAGGLREMVEAGCLMFYTDSIRGFLKTILQETDEEANKYPADKVWQLYINLVIMEGQKILDKGSF